MRDEAAFDFIVAYDGGEDWQAGGIGGGPALGSKLVGVKVEDGSLGGLPATIGFSHDVKFVETSCGGIDNDGVSVTGRFVALDLIECEFPAGRIAFVVNGPAFDGDVIRDGVRAFVGFAGVVGNFDGDFFLVRRDNDEGHIPVVAQGFVGADGLDDLFGVWMEGPFGDVGIPGVVFREDLHGPEDAVSLRGIEHDGLGDFGEGGFAWRIGIRVSGEKEEGHCKKIGSHG